MVSFSDSGACSMHNHVYVSRAGAQSQFPDLKRPLPAAILILQPPLSDELHQGCWSPKKLAYGPAPVECPEYPRTGSRPTGNTGLGLDTA